MADPRSLRRVQQQFKLRGLAVTLDAARAVAQHMSDPRFLTVEEAFDEILARLERKNLTSTIVSLEVIKEVITSLAEGAGKEDSQFKLMDAFAMPKLCYDPVRKTFYLSTTKRSIFGDAKSKTALYRERMQILLQRLMRNKLFMKPVFALEASDSTNYCELTPLQSLVGCAGCKYTMGSISQLEDGRFFLEDFSASIPIDLSKTVTTAGLFTENCIVVAEGELQADGVFQVRVLGLPPIESREESVAVLGGVDIFGAGAVGAEEANRLRVQEQDATDEMFVIISDIWIDQQETMEKLATVLDGFEGVDPVPSALVFIGNFCSRPCNLANHDFRKMRSQFAKLGELIAAHPRIKAASRMIFVPGPGDVGPVNAVPRPAIMKFFAQAVLEHLPEALFVSNPCRIKFYTQEIVVFREDLLHRMRRACVLRPSEEETAEPFEHLVATVLQQSHLCPLPLTQQPILWDYDHALHLYPIPSVLVLADRAQQRQFYYEGVAAFNPGSFAQDGTFVVYRPATREAELSAI